MHMQSCQNTHTKLLPWASSWQECQTLASDSNEDIEWVKPHRWTWDYRASLHHDTRPPQCRAHQARGQHYGGYPTQPHAPCEHDEKVTCKSHDLSHDSHMRITWTCAVCPTWTWWTLVCAPWTKLTAPRECPWDQWNHQSGSTGDRDDEHIYSLEWLNSHFHCISFVFSFHHCQSHCLSHFCTSNM